MVLSTAYKTIYYKLYTFAIDILFLHLRYRFCFILTKVKVSSRKLKQQQEAVEAVYDSMISLNLLAKLHYQDQPSRLNIPVVLIC